MVLAAEDARLGRIAIKFTHAEDRGKAEREAALANGSMEEDGDFDDGMTTDGESEWGDDDAPRVGLDELLDDLEEMAIED